MNFKLVFHQEALDELQDAHDWYDQQRKGLGFEFMDSIDETARRIMVNPETFPMVHGR
jgi:hypothetical protein